MTHDLHDRGTDAILSDLDTIPDHLVRLLEQHTPGLFGEMPKPPLTDLSSGHDRQHDDILSGCRDTPEPRTYSFAAAEHRRDVRDAQSGGRR